MTEEKYRTGLLLLTLVLVMGLFAAPNVISQRVTANTSTNATQDRAATNSANHSKNMLNTVTLDEAKRVIANAEKKAREMNKQYNLAVVDAGGNLLAFQRMDGAWLGSIELAINKAYTARVFDISTKDLGNYSQPGAQFYGIQTQPRIVVFAGGLPLKRNGVVIGAIGASGGLGAEDQAVAEAGAAGF